MKYITTSIAYPNANPHIGYALELVQADFLARYARNMGDASVLVTGLDEHGLKIQRAAQAAGISPEDFVREKADTFRRLADMLGMEYGRFIRTTDPDHVAMAQALWRVCAQNGYIYKQQYQAWYDVKEEEFLGLAADYPDPSVFGVEERFLELIDEENYFFALSKCTDSIVTHLEKGYVVPEERGKEILNFIRDRGIKDISISRDASKLSWGIPVPDDTSQVMYVWFDALTNYLTAAATLDGAGRIMPDTERWPAALHCVGKDISRFHAIIWPGMLLAASLPLPEHLLVHGFITSGGQKMSKSLGNVIDPFPLLERYGDEAVRWFLLKEVPTTGDADITEDRMASVYSADLANDLGNLVSRVQAMTQRYVDGRVPATAGAEAYLGQAVREGWEVLKASVERYEVHQGLSAVLDVAKRCNQFIEEQKPWVLAKEGNTEVLSATLAALLEAIAHLSFMLQAAMPVTAQKIAAGLFPENDQLNGLVPGAFPPAWGLLQEGEKVGEERLVLFPRLDEKTS